jgi:hypothetical protein
MFLDIAYWQYFNILIQPNVTREEDVFKNYNSPHKPVRVFTYLIGREISDLKAANWMACTNKGNMTTNKVYTMYINRYLL